MEEKYIDCDRCVHWELELRHKNVCPICKNTGKRLNPKNILCNMCGESLCHDIKTKSGHWNSDEAHGLINASVMGKYESYHLFDMTSYHFNMCELCLRKMFTQFVIKPKVADNDFSGGSSEESWDQDQKSYEYRLWRDSDAYHQAYLNKKCNLAKDCPNNAAYTVLIGNAIWSDECSCEEHKTRYAKTINAKLVKFISDDLRVFL